MPANQSWWRVGDIDPITGAYLTSTGETRYASPVATHPNDPSMWGRPEGGGSFLRGSPQWNDREGKWERPLAGGNLLAAGIGAAMGAPFLAGALGGGGAAGASAAPQASSALPAVGGSLAGTTGSTVPVIGQLAGAGVQSGVTGGSNMFGGGLLGKIFGKGGLDPTTLALGGLSLLGGGDEGPQRKESFKGTGADPVSILTEALNATRGFGEGLRRRGPTRLRSSFVPPPPVPVDVPGVPFQIGGGLGMDPALGDPRILERVNPLEMFSMNQPAEPRSTSRRRPK